MSNLWRQHWVIIVISVVIGFVYVAPHLFFANSLGENYKGIYISRSYDEDAYYAIVRQAYDGVSVTDNPYIAEYKGESIGSMYKFPEYIIGKVGAGLGLSISTVAIISKFIFPAILVLVAYIFLFLLSGSKMAGILGSVFLLLGHELAPLSISSAIKTLTFSSPFESFLFYNRPINPQVSAIFFFLFLIALLLAWKDAGSKQKAITAGVALGILSYLYFYFWNFSMILAGVAFLYALALRNKMLIKSLLIVIGVSLVVSVPFFIDVVQALGGQAAAIGKNYVLTHRFIIEKVILVPLILLVGVGIWKRSLLTDIRFIFLFLLVLAGFIASNQQVIHGYEVQQHHYHFMTNIPVWILFLSVVIPLISQKLFKKYWLALPIAACIVIAVHGISVQASSYTFWKNDFTHYQKYDLFFDWLNENSKVNDVVYGDAVISELVPVYTHNTIYSSLHASVYPVPLDRLEHNYFTYLYVEGVTSAEAKEYLYKEENRNRIGQWVFEGQYWRAACGSFGCFPDATLDDLIAKYRKFLSNSIEENLKKYKINYILWDKNKEPEWGIDKLAFVEKVLEEDNVSLWRIK